MTDQEMRFMLNDKTHIDAFMTNLLMSYKNCLKIYEQRLDDGQVDEELLEILKESQHAFRRLQDKLCPEDCSDKDDGKNAGQQALH